MKRTSENNIEWLGIIENKEFSNILFNELIIKKAELKNVIFKNVHFKNCNLGLNSKYTDCKFIDCKFYGKYSSLGKPCKFANCEFLNCEFNGVDLLVGVHFFNCIFSGLFKNQILSNKNSKTENNETIFEDCSLTNLKFNNVHIYGNNIFDNCILPKSGIGLFDNTNDKLINRAEEICKDLHSNDKIESEIIFKRELKNGQNPLILDELFLESFFKTNSSRKIFEEIVKGYEVRNN